MKTESATIPCLSVRQPWTHALMFLGKKCENRTWKAAPKYRGPILLHAGKGCTAEEYHDAGHFMCERGLVEYIGEHATLIESRVAQGLSKPNRILPRIADLPRGGIVARARLADAVWTDRGGHRRMLGESCRLCGAPAELPEDLGRATGTCPKPDPWAIPGALGLILADVEPLGVCVPWRGMLGLFPVGVVAFEEQLAAARAKGASR